MTASQVKKKTKSQHIKTYAFIDASNIIYGTQNEGWKVDFQKLIHYLYDRYNCKKIYYFAGFNKKNKKQQKFYNFLKNLGYELILKPIKLYPQPNGEIIRKANCDVDLTFFAMRDQYLFDRGIFLTGDGDFEILLKYFLCQKKALIVIANAKRTAHEIKILKGIQFNDFGSLKKTLQRQ